MTNYPWAIFKRVTHLIFENKLYTVQTSAVQEYRVLKIRWITLSMRIHGMGFPISQLSLLLLHVNWKSDIQYIHVFLNSITVQLSSHQRKPQLCNFYFHILVIKILKFPFQFQIYGIILHFINFLSLPNTMVICASTFLLFNCAYMYILLNQELLRKWIWCCLLGCRFGYKMYKIRYK